MQKTAQELASLGRNGDTMLMHVQPSEVAGLQALAKANGTTLTTNPHTGMPEAFNLGGALEALAPTLAGAALVGISGGALTPLAAGLMVGGVQAVRTGDVMKGAMAGLGAYGGGGLGESLAATGAATPAASAPGMTGGNTGITPGASVPGQGLTVNAANGTVPTGAMPTQSGIGGVQPGANALSAPPSTFSNMGAGAKNLLTGQEGSWDAFTKAAGGQGKAAFQLGMPIATGVMGGQDKYKPPVEDNTFHPLNLSGPAPLKLYAGGGAIDNAGILGVYGTPDGTQGPPISQDGYGLGRLNSMAMNQGNAQGPGQNGNYAGFAKGGYLDGAGDGMSDSIPAKIDGKQPAALADGEFVVPADVVSHIGNGSTKAGAHRLYDMMAKIRKARTGNSAQGKQINPHKFMPA